MAFSDQIKITAPGMEFSGGSCFIRRRAWAVEFRWRDLDWCFVGSLEFATDLSNAVSEARGMLSVAHGPFVVPLHKENAKRLYRGHDKALRQLSRPVPGGFWERARDLLENGLRNAAGYEFPKSSVLKERAA